MTKRAIKFANNCDDKTKAIAEDIANYAFNRVEGNNMATALCITDAAMKALMGALSLIPYSIIKLCSNWLASISLSA